MVWFQNPPWSEARMLHYVLAREIVRDREREIERDLRRRQLVADIVMTDRNRAATDPAAIGRVSTGSTAVCVTTPHRPARAG